MAIEVEKDVPASEVDEQIAICHASGATKVEKIEQPNNVFTIRATYPDNETTKKG